MLKLNVLFLIAFTITSTLCAQTIYVDVLTGKTDGSGSKQSPMSSLEKAVEKTKSFTGKEPITIKIGAGLYILQHVLEITAGKGTTDATKYTLEATILPDDPDWLPTKMPVIQSVAANNSTTQFAHCTGILVSRDNVSLKGLKFVGNPNPGVKYYYPVTREIETFKGLEISQCYFIGDKNATPIQGAVWAHGAGIQVDHSIFYGCKNALLLFKSISDLSITNSIIQGAYEAAVWFGPFTVPFTFQNNIVTGCNYFWLRPADTDPAYEFRNCVIVDNEQYLGFYTNNGAVPAPSHSVKETNIIKSGQVMLSDVKTNGLPDDHLNVVGKSTGEELHAGIFKIKKP